MFTLQLITVSRTSFFHTLQFHLNCHLFVPVDEKYENEAPFQLYWFACNCTLTLVLTLVVKVKSISIAGVNFYQVLDLGSPSIVQDQYAQYNDF